MTAYEVAKESSIPTSKIYEVMGRLIDREIAQPIESSGTRRYTGIDPDEFLARQRAQFESSVNRAGARLAAVRSDARVTTIWNIGDREHLIEKSIRMIESAKEHILLSVFREEMDDLYPHLKKAEKRKVKTAVVHFGENDKSAGMTFAHPIADTIFEEKGGRSISLVTDSKEALIGTIMPKGDVEGGWSCSHGFVTLTEDYIKHDIYIMKIVTRYDSELIARFGENYAMLRDIFSDRER
jgi:sugar-specific transcriptional regulator TrmB